MSDAELAALAESIFSDAAGAGTGFDAALWSTLEETGLARLTLPEAAGGSAGSFADSAVVLAAAGAQPRGCRSSRPTCSAGGCCTPRGSRSRPAR